MLLLFLRHAEAEPNAADDAARPLTRQGRRDARAIGKYLRRAGLRCDAAFTSPLVRAVETAKLALKENPLPRKAKLTVTRALLNGATAAEFERFLKRLPKNAQAVLLVGHAPSLAERVARLLGVTHADAIHLSKGAVAVLATEDHARGTLKLLLAPRLLAK